MFVFDCIFAHLAECGESGGLVCIWVGRGKSRLVAIGPAEEKGKAFCK